MSNLKCPACGSESVTTAHIQTFMVNTGEHYCHSVKTLDDNSPAHCLDCGWRGERKALLGEDSRITVCVKGETNHESN